jgi:hypothetical protein
MLLRGLFALIVIAIVAGIGVYVYNVGVAQGVAQGAAARGDGVAAAPYYGWPVFFPGGFGLFFCLPFLLLWLLFPLFGWRRWGRPPIATIGGWARHREHWGKSMNVPPMFEEWHRRAHEPQPEPKKDDASPM